VGDATTAEAVNGALWGMYVDYNGAAATTVVTVSEVGGANRVLFVTAAGNTDRLWMPRRETQNAADGTDTGSFEPEAAVGRTLKVAVSAADDEDVITVRLIKML
jgi:hypothetical protein